MPSSAMTSGAIIITGDKTTKIYMILSFLLFFSPNINTPAVFQMAFSVNTPTAFRMAFSLNTLTVFQTAFD